MGLFALLALVLSVYAYHRGHGVKAMLAVAFLVGLAYGQTPWAPNVTHTALAIWHGINASVSRL